jgi:NDP-sugar pyrophosphorylase family protein
MIVPTTAMVLAAGLGIRLRPLTDVRAKPAVPVAGRPLVRHIIAWLASYGVRDVVVNLHHHPETVAAVLGDGTDLGVAVRYSWEQPVLLGSAGGPRLALSILGVEQFWLVNGDTLTDVNLRALAARHEASGARVSLAVVPSVAPHKYGGVRIDERARVVGFARRGEASGTAHFTGVQLVEADVFRGLPPGQPSSTIGSLYDAMVAGSPGSIGAYMSEARFWDIGTPADYLATCRALATSDRAWHGDRVRIDPTARLDDTILWDDVTVGPMAVLDRCIVTDGVSVPARAEYHQRVLIVGRHGHIRAEPFADA